MTQVTVADNFIMRKISAWGAIFMVPTAIAGVYGMNFDFMPKPLALRLPHDPLRHRSPASPSPGFRRNGWL